MALTLTPRAARYARYGAGRRAQTFAPSAAPEPFVPATQYVTDLVKPVLEADPALSNDNRAQLWDLFHASNSHNELARTLQPLAVPDDTKRKLVQAKKQSMPPAITPLEKATAAVNRIKEIDSDVLELAESHPNALRHLINGALK